MKRIIRPGVVVVTAAVALVVALDVLAGETAPAGKREDRPAPYTDWEKLSGVLRMLYADRDAVSEERLNEAMVKGILDSLGGRVRIVRTGEEGAAAKPSPSVARAEVINGAIGYVRLSTIDATTPAGLDRELEKMGKDKLRGLVLDLRFADGEDFGQAAAVAWRFLPKGAKAFTINDPVTNKAQDFVNSEIEGVNFPVAVLINAQTRGAAEAVAAALRAQDRAILIGNSSAGMAAVETAIQLDEHHVLRLATARVTFPNALEAFPRGLTPDVPVQIDEATEKDVLIDNPPKKSLTELFEPKVVKARVSEAELVRTHRGEATTLMQPAQPAQRPEGIRDAPLQRAVDLLKGIAALGLPGA